MRTRTENRKVVAARKIISAEDRQRRIITDELNRVKRRLLDKGFNLDFSTSPTTWQVFSTILAGVPSNMVLDEENILDMIGYYIFLLADVRATGVDDWTKAAVMGPVKATTRKASAGKKSRKPATLRKRAAHKGRK